MPTDPSPLMTIATRDGDEVGALDGSHLRLLARTAHASMAHGTLGVGQVSHAVVHRTVDELWLVLGGQAEIWRGHPSGEHTVLGSTGDSLAIPCGTPFQYRVVGPTPFTFVMATTPAWPGDDEATIVTGPWPPRDADPAPATT